MTQLDATEADYVNQQQALMPSGAAWPTDSNSVWGRLLAVMAATWARLHNRGVDLIEEADWRTTFELLPDWERIAGLPDPCAGEVQSLAGRRRRLVAAMTARGGANAAYFIAMADAMGYYIEIRELHPSTVDGCVDDELLGLEAAFTWVVVAPLISAEVATVDGTVDECLLAWTNSPLECWIEARKPAHSHVLFIYVDINRSGRVSDRAEGVIYGGRITVSPDHYRDFGGISA